MDWQTIFASVIGRPPAGTKCPKCGAALDGTAGRLLELLLVLTFCLAPQFLLASRISADEFGKATSGVILAGIVLTAYRVFKGAKTEKSEEEDDDGDGE